MLNNEQMKITDFERERREKDQEQNIISCLPDTPSQGSSPQPEYVPQLGTEPATLWYTA